MSNKKELGNEDLQKVSGGVITRGKYLIYTVNDFPNLTPGQTVKVFSGSGMSFNLLGEGTFVCVYNQGFKLNYNNKEYIITERHGGYSIGPVDQPQPGR